MRRYTLTLMALLVCLMFSGCFTKKQEPVEITLPFTLDLSQVEEGTLPKEIRVITGDWKVIDNALEVDFPPQPGEGLGAFLHFSGLELADFDMRVSISFEEVQGDSRFAMLLFRADHLNLPRHKIQVRRGGTRADGLRVLFRNAENTSKEQARDSYSEDFELGKVYDFRLAVCGNKVKLFIDNNLVFDEVIAEEEWYRDKGAVGLGVFGGRARFSNISIDSITPEEFEAL